MDSTTDKIKKGIKEAAGTVKDAAEKVKDKTVRAVDKGKDARSAGRREGERQNRPGLRTRSRTRRETLHAPRQGGAREGWQDTAMRSRPAA